MVTGGEGNQLTSAESIKKVLMEMGLNTERRV